MSAIAVFLAKKIITKTSTIAMIVIVVVAAIGGWTWFSYNYGKSSMLPKITQIATDFQVFKNGIHANSAEADKSFEILTQVYEVELSAMEREYELQIKNLNVRLSSYNSQRLRDKNRLRTAEDRISSLSETAGRLAGSDERARILSGKLEQLEGGVLSRLVDPAERDLARLRLCQKYLHVVRRLKDKYDSLRAQTEIVPAEVLPTSPGKTQPGTP